MAFGDPVDPDYVAFKAGLERAVADTADKHRQRWDPKDRKWYTFAASDWGFEDLGLSDTPPEGAIRTKGWPVTYSLTSLGLPDLWERLEKAYRTHSSRYPSMRLVWSPWGDGDWRAAFKRSAGQVPHVPPKAPTAQPSARALAQVREIEQWRDRGYISADQAQKMITAVIQADLADA